MSLPPIVVTANISIYADNVNITFPPGQPQPESEVVEALKEGFTQMTEQLDTLTSEVAEISSVADSAVSLINGLSQQIRDLSDDPAALQALADQLDAKSNELAAAVAANTPAAPEPAPEEPTPGE